MEKNDIQKRLEELNIIFEELESKIDINSKLERIKELENITSNPNFWNDINATKEPLEELKRLKNETSIFNRVKESIKSYYELLELDLSSEEIEELNNEIIELEKSIEHLRIETLLNGEYDSNSAYMEIHSGAGGTESNDWANMLFRMYTRFFDKNDYTYEIISEQSGEEVGIKGITLLIKGSYTYGYLKGETGVHRLVRISPFDSNSRRHTSFASVLVTPEIKNDKETDIKESDLKIDVYHSSGAGGQSVNTTDSAVRITHLPSGIVVSCQVERSQVKNKERAMNMLKNKLFILNQKEFNDKVKDLKGDVMDVNFGSAIRSYVMCPYTLVKDNRTNYETSNVERVLDGEINEFLEEYLKK